MSFLANLLTSFSLVCGFFSIILALEGHFVFAAWGIILAVIFDALNGQVARRNPVPNYFGEIFDSLVDVISFGVAPTILGFTFVYHDFHVWAVLSLFLYLLASVVRLALYNITDREIRHKFYYGMPTTASAGLLASFILVFRGHSIGPRPEIFFGLVVFLVVMMVTRIRYVNLDGLLSAVRKERLFFLWAILVVGAVSGVFWLVWSVFMPEIVLFGGFVFYVISPLFLRKFV